MKMMLEQITSPADASFLVREYLQPKLTTPFHFHDEYELVYIAKSHGKLYAGNSVNNFRQDEMYFFGPRLAHCFYNDKDFVASGEPAHFIVIQFKEDFLGEAFFNSPELFKIKRLLEQSQHGIKINNPGEELRSFFFSIAASSGMQRLLLMLRLLDATSLQTNPNISYIINVPGNADGKNTPEKLELVFAYVLENFMHEVSSSAAAGLACMNEAAFCRYFKRRTRKTFSAFVNEVRITHATKLLLGKNCRVLDVCFECGFNNQSYFNRQFKSITGKTPFDYRKDFMEAAAG